MEQAALLPTISDVDLPRQQSRVFCKTPPPDNPRQIWREKMHQSVYQHYLQYIQDHPTN